MSRVKGASSFKNRKKIRKLSKGFRGCRSRLYKVAKETIMRAQRYAYRDRRQRKRVFRQLWIARLSAATRANGLQYSRFISGLKELGIELNRKVLSEMAIHDEKTFQILAEKAKAAVKTA